MVIQARSVTAEAFDQFVLLPENRDRNFELIAGEIVEVVSNSYSSLVSMLLGGRVSVFVFDHGLGWVTGADGGYWVGDERYIPDAAYISKVRQPQPSHDAYNPNPPDLAIEVLSPSDDRDDLRLKIVNYLNAGTTLWVVNPPLKTVEVYVPGQKPRVLTINDTLDGGAVLPGFTLAVKDVFPE
jgi:Uma2 family endonuclease